jgi:hypothetical protein
MVFPCPGGRAGGGDMFGNGLKPGCFGFLADSLLRDLREEAAQQAIMAPFWDRIPEDFGGLLDLQQRQQRKLIIGAEVQRILAHLAPHETDIRPRYALAAGDREFAPHTGYRRRWA